MLFHFDVRFSKRWLCTLLLAGVFTAPAQAQVPEPVAGPTPHAPPAPPPIVVNPLQSKTFKPTPPPEGLTPYSIGNPTDEEQQYLEYINRARANPTAEGLRLASTTDPEVLSAYAFFGVDTNLMVSQFETLSPVPPVALNAKLINAARLHSGNMFTNEYQGHYETNGATILSPGDRITAAGYTSWYTYGENVFAYSDSVYFGHAGFEVDWGSGPGGMQDPPGHRQSIHNGTFREVGIGIVDGTHGPVGPQLVTEDFATTTTDQPFITGVVYYDLNGNGFYDPGEGIGGVTVLVPGSTYFAITASSGGYTVPVTTNGVYDMTFSAPNLSYQTTANVSNLANVKVDYLPVYVPPTLTGPEPAALNQNNYYVFSPIGGATNYQWELATVAAYTTVAGAENGTNDVTIVSSPLYSVLASDVHASGSYSYHFCHTNPAPQSLTLNADLLLNSNSQVTFAKRLGWATSNQVARVQISTDSGSTWQDLWSQPGTGSSGDPAFVRITNSLAAYAGMTAQIRFIYDYNGGAYFPQSSTGIGLYLDDIAVANAGQIESPVVNDVPEGTAFIFSPSNAGNYQLRVRAQLSGRTLPWGPPLQVSATNLPPVTVAFAGMPIRLGNLFQADFTVTNYRAGTLFRLLQSPSLTGSWAVDPGATVATVVSNSRFRVTTTNSASQTFYQLQAN